MQANPTVALDKTCDRCGTTERLEHCDQWTYCATCAADWLGYVNGCQVMTIYAVGQAVVEAKHEGLSSAQIARYVQFALEGHHHRDNAHEVVGG